MIPWLYVAVLLPLIVAYLLWPRKKVVDIRKFPRKFPDEKGTERPHYDVIVVGAGPAGSCFSYYFSKLGRKVLLLEKQHFPRDKICGDALCKTGIEILHEMGVYREIIDNNYARIADAGGMCSPCGLSYIGRSKEIMGEIPGALACKRILLDEVLVRAAQRAGAELVEDTPVGDVKFDKNAGLWTVSIENSDTTYQGRVLICADGAPSRLATKLGLVNRPPQGSCSRSYIEGGTHNFKADGVIFYNKDILPGYGCLFKHPNDMVNFCVYIIPGNPEVTDDKLAYWHKYLAENDQNISKCFNKNTKSERMKAGSLRLGGEPLTYGDHVVVLGDAAGMIDPMTGEGIHHAMDSGRIAARFLDEAFKVGNFDKAVTEEYQNRWMNAFGHDYKWSMIFVQMAYRFPIILDAGTAAVMRKGDKFLARWADIMTGRVPKRNLLRPEFSIVITFELINLLVQRMFGFGRKPVVKDTTEKKTD